MNWLVVYQVITYYILFLAVFYFAGAIPTYFIIKQSSFKQNYVLLTPIIGAGIICLGLEWLITIGLTGRQSIIFISLFLLVLNIWFFLFVTRSNLNFFKRLINKKEILYLGISFLLVIILSIPLFNNKELLIIGGNGDAVSYSSVAKYILDGKLSDITGHKINLENKPNLQLLSNVINSNMRLGPSYLMSYFNFLTNKDSYQTFTLISNVFLLLGVLATVIMGKSLYNLGKIGVINLIILLSFNTLYIWGSYGDFLSQIEVYPFFILSILFFIKSFENDSFRDSIISGLFLSVVYSIYPEAIVYLVGFLLFYMIFNYKKLIMMIRKLIILVIASIIANLFGIYRFLLYVLPKLKDKEFESSANRAISGDIHHFLDIREIFGIIPHTHSAPIELGLLTNIVSSTIFISILIFLTLGFIKLDKKYKLISLSICGTFIAMALVNRYLNFPYGYYKTISLFIPFILLLIIVSMRKLNFKISSLVIIILIMANIASFTILSSKMKSPITTEMTSLMEVSQTIGENNLLYTDLYQNSVKQMWLFYLLSQNKISASSVMGYYGDPRLYQINGKFPDCMLIKTNDKSTIDNSIWDQSKTINISEYSILQKKDNIKNVYNPSEDFIYVGAGKTIELALSNNKLAYISEENSEFQVADGDGLFELSTLNSNSKFTILAQNNADFDASKNTFHFYNNGRIFLKNDSSNPIFIKHLIELNKY